MSPERRGDAFGATARRYDYFRPSYPAELVDDLMGFGPRDVLDVGCGTGKLGRLLADRGAAVLGVEIDDRMAALARGHGLAVETASFETWPDRGRRFDLLVSGQAWHWLDPAKAARRAHDLLRATGRLALCWNRTPPPNAAGEAIDAVYARYAPTLAEGRASDAEENMRAHRERLAQAGPFDPIEVRGYRWRSTRTTEEYVQMISTFSDHAALAEPVRAALLDAVRAVIDDAGGTVTLDYTTHAIIARPVPGD